jgi:hypothetical protein
MLIGLEYPQPRSRDICEAKYVEKNAVDTGGQIEHRESAMLRKITF